VEEYDAFGRRIGEDPLEELGWKASGADAAPAEAAPAEAEHDARAAAPADTAGRETWLAASLAAAPAQEPAAVDGLGARPVFVRRRPRGRGGGRGLATLVVIVGAAGALALYAGGTAPLTVDSGPAGTDATPRARAPSGLQTGSLIRRDTFGAAVERLRTAGLGRLTLLRVAPARIDARLLTRGGRLRNVQLRHDGVETAAPERLARAASRRLGVPAARVDYLVLTKSGWSVVFEGGRQFSADDAGRNLRRIS
jgi:hypothetical protein